MSRSSYPVDLGNGTTAGVVTPHRWRFDGTGKVIVGFVGHGGNAAGWIPGGTAYDQTRFLVENTGCAVVGISGGGPTSWGSQAAVDSFTQALSVISTNANIKGDSTKVGLLGHSMGGLAAMNVLKRNKAKIKCTFLWEPALDLDWNHSTAGYTTPWTSTTTADSTWVAEINTAYGNNFAANSVGFNPIKDWASYTDAGPIKIVHCTDDTLIYSAVSDYFASKVPNVELVKPSTGGHMPFNYVDPSVMSNFFAKYMFA